MSKWIKPISLKKDDKPFVPKENPKNYRDYPEFRFMQSMDNEVRPNLLMAMRHLGKNAKYADCFDKELGNQVRTMVGLMEEFWDYLLGYQEESLKPLFAAEAEEEGEEEEAEDE